MQNVAVPDLYTIGLNVSTPASVAWPANNRIYYVPLLMPDDFLATQFGIDVGATNSANIEIGIYTPDGVKLIGSAATALGTANSPQAIDITDTQLYAGNLYYVGVTLTSTGGALFCVTSGLGVAGAQMTSTMAENGSGGLPNPATFAAIADNLIPYFSLSSKTVL